MSHRGHTETLRLQAEANSIQTKAAAQQTLANINHTKASDQWAFYQAQNIRNHEYKNELKKLKFGVFRPGSDKEQEEARKEWEMQVEKYEGKLDSSTGKPRGGSLDKIKATAESLDKQAQTYQTAAIATLLEADKKTEESHHLHHAVNWIDFGHLAIEFALVLCSVAVLTKSRHFWGLGVLVAVGGASLVGYGIYGLAGAWRPCYPPIMRPLGASRPLRCSSPGDTFDEPMEYPPGAKHYNCPVHASPPLSGIRNPGMRPPRLIAGSQKRLKRHRRRFFATNRSPRVCARGLRSFSPQLPPNTRLHTLTPPHNPK
jgi:hypothetical protein